MSGETDFNAKFCPRCGKECGLMGHDCAPSAARIAEVAGAVEARRDVEAIRKADAGAEAEAHARLEAEEATAAEPALMTEPQAVIYLNHRVITFLESEIAEQLQPLVDDLSKSERDRADAALVLRCAEEHVEALRGANETIFRLDRASKVQVATAEDLRKVRPIHVAGARLPRGGR